MGEATINTSIQFGIDDVVEKIKEIRALEIKDRILTGERLYHNLTSALGGLRIMHFYFAIGLKLKDMGKGHLLTKEHILEM